MRNFKIKERLELLEQKIQATDKDTQNELFKELRLKKETLFNKVRTGQLRIDKTGLIEDKLNLTRKETLFIFFEEEEYSKELKQSDFEYLRSKAKKQSKEAQAFIEGIISILNEAKTTTERDYLFNQIRKVLSE